MSFLKKYRYDIGIVTFLAIFIILFIILRDRYGMFSDRENFEAFIKSFGPLAPIIIILIIILEVVVAPLPGFIPAISAGFIFGPYEGAIYTFIGNLIGSSLAFFLARKFGKYIVLKFIKEGQLDKYAKIIEKRENILLALYALPIVPIDVISAAFGLSKIKFKKYIIAVSIGFAIHVLLLNYFGNYLADLYF